MNPDRQCPDVASHLPSVDGGRPIAHLALVGPTASGKTELAIEVAKSLGDVEILMADAMCVYRGMDIGTAKPALSERGEVPHHLIDLADPSEDFSISRFVSVAEESLEAIAQRGRRALVVGGSGLYVRALVDDFAPPPEFPEERSEVESEKDTGRLHARLADLDPVAAARMEPSNRRRIVRALEVTLGSGRPFSSHGSSLSDYPRTPFRQVGLWLSRDTLRQRISARYEQQMTSGFLDEVARLRDASPPISRTAGQALGYRELLSHLRGELGLQEALERAITRTRAFARRQRMWFRRDPRITWFGADGDPSTVLPALLGDWGRP